MTHQQDATSTRTGATSTRAGRSRGRLQRVQQYLRRRPIKSMLIAAVVAAITFFFSGFFGAFGEWAASPFANAPDEAPSPKVQAELLPRGSLGDYLGGYTGVVVPNEPDAIPRPPSR